MANLMHEHPNQGWVYDGNWWHDLNVYVNSQDVAGNFSNISVEIVAYSISAGNSQSGTWNGQIWVGGALAANTTSTRNISNSGQQIAVWSGNYGHDANGNLTIYTEFYVNEPATSMSRRGANWGIARIPLAPPITSIIVDTIQPTSARLGLEIGGFGHGTATSMHMGYRVQGSGTWIYVADQPDAAGYNYWSITGLLPATTYEYYGTAYNNNGDTSNSGIQTFVTLSVPGMLPVLIGLIS